MRSSFLPIALAALCSCAIAAPPLDSARQQELAYLLKQDCGSCHGMTLRGGLGPPLLSSALAEKPDEYLQIIIAKGVAVRGMPPWKGILSEADINHIIKLLRTNAVVEEQEP